jgi:hypothetical protein
VTAQLTGDGFAALPLHLADDGAAPDGRAKDGILTGTVTVPDSATGRLKVAATLTASGLTADQDRSDGTLIAPQQVLASAALTPPAGSAHTSDRLTATLSLHNGDQVPHVLGVRIDDGSGLVVPSPDRITVAPGASPTVTLGFAVAGRAAFGHRLDKGSAELGGKIVVFDTTDNDRVLTEPLLSLHVSPRPGWLSQYQWYLVGGAVAVVLVALLLASRSRLGKLRRDAAGLPLQLLSEDGRVLTSQRAKSGNRGWFEFDVAEPRSPHPRIVRRPGGTFRVQRDPNGGAVLEGRGRSRERLRVGDPVPLGNGLLLALGSAPPAPARDTGGPATGPATAPFNDYL